MTITRRDRGAPTPWLYLARPNRLGTGAAVRLKAHPAEVGHRGCLSLALARQKSACGETCAVPVRTLFDWKNGICAKLCFLDVAKVVRVLRGECGSLGDGGGIDYSRAGEEVRVTLRRMAQPVRGYCLSLGRSRDGSWTRRSEWLRFCVRESEAAGLVRLLTGSLPLIGFGIPVAGDDGDDFAEGVAGRRDDAPASPSGADFGT